jgi:hypothetical protein
MSERIIRGQTLSSGVRLCFKTMVTLYATLILIAA